MVNMMADLEPSVVASELADFGRLVEAAQPAEKAREGEEWGRPSGFTRKELSEGPSCPIWNTAILKRRIKHVELRHRREIWIMIKAVIVKRRLWTAR